MLSPLFLSSGDLIADRRFAMAQEFAGRGDFFAAVDLLRQTVDMAPRFAGAWHFLGDVLERLDDSAGAAGAFASALAADPEDRHGAALRLRRLGKGGRNGEMPPAYLRALFDQYATDFERALTKGLNYQGPQLLYEAVRSACGRCGRSFQFGSMLDLGCGTGLVGAAFRPHVDRLVGVDLSPRMIAKASAKEIYDDLHVAALADFVAVAPATSCDLVTAADVFVYIGDLAPVVSAIARMLAPDGFFAFTLETAEGEDVVLRDTLRFAHSVNHIQRLIVDAGLTLIETIDAPARSEKGVDVDGLVIVARRP